MISFQHVLHFDVGRSEIGWNMKLKMGILHRAKSATKHHSNPYKIIGRAGASPPSRTTGLRCLYIYVFMYPVVRVPDTVNF